MQKLSLVISDIISEVSLHEAIIQRIMIQSFMLEFILLIQIFLFVNYRNKRITFLRILFLLKIPLHLLLFLVVLILMLLLNFHLYILYEICNLYKSIFDNCYVIYFIMKNLVRNQQLESMSKTTKIQKVFSSSLFNQPFEKQAIIYRLKNDNLFRLSKNQQINRAQKKYVEEKDECKDWLKQGLFYSPSPSTAQEDLMKMSLPMGQTYFYLNTGDILSIKQKQKNYNLPTLIKKKSKLINSQNLESCQHYSNKKKTKNQKFQKGQEIQKPLFLTQKIQKINTNQNQLNLPICKKTNKQQKKVNKISSSFHNHSMNQNSLRQHKKICFQQKLSKLKNLYDSQNFSDCSSINQKNKVNSHWNQYNEPVRLSPKNNFLRSFTNKQNLFKNARNQRQTFNQFYSKKNQELDDLKRIKDLNLSTQPFFKNLKTLQKQTGIGCFDQLSHIFNEFPNCQSILDQSCISSKRKSKDKKMKQSQKKKENKPSQKENNIFLQQKKCNIPEFLLKTLYNQKKEIKKEQQTSCLKNENILKKLRV